MQPCDAPLVDITLAVSCLSATPTPYLRLAPLVDILWPYPYPAFQPPPPPYLRLAPLVDILWPYPACQEVQD